MESGIKIGPVSNEKWQTIHNGVLKLPNQVVIRTLGRKETCKY